MHKRYYTLLVCALLLMIIPAACRKEEKKDLFPQQDEALIAELTQAPVPKQGEPSKQGAEEDKMNPVREEDKVKEASQGNAEIKGTEAEGDSMVKDANKEAAQFYYEELSEEIKARIADKSYGKDCDVPYEELRYVRVLYWGFDEEEHNGELIVNKAIAQDTVDIFKDLYEIKYPIEQMVLVDEYDADDNTSMAADNTSAFNYRKVDGTNRISKHSYGLAIDINPRYNPYVRERDGETIITPVNGIEYADRSLNNPYYITEGDPCYKAFIDRGFTWGGAWKNSKDYQHFEKKAD